jgi:zinc protease
MVDLAPSEPAVLSERDVVIEERRQVVDSDPGARFGEEVVAALYLNHPYGRPVIGWEHEIMGLDLPTAMAFYRAHYAPNNAVLVVAGDAEAEAVLRLAEKHFGPIPPSGAIEPRSRPQEPPHRAARRIDMRDPRVSEPVLSRSYLAPQRRTGDQREAAALVVLAELLGGAPGTSVMGQELLLGEGIAVGAEAYYSSIGLEARTFDLYVVPKPGVGLAEVEAELDRLIARFVEQGPDTAQLERIKGRVRAGEVYVLDDLVERASRVGAGLSSGLTLDDIEQWPGMLQAVTAEEVQAAARSLFVIENSVTGWLRPEPEGSSEPTR